MKALDHTLEFRPDRYATQLLHDEAAGRIVAFGLLPGQQVPTHTSSSLVLVTVVEGEGVFHGSGGSAHLKAGESLLYAPGEPHSMEAGGEPLRFLAVITPRPGG